jgi:hypothetical protein
VLRNKWSFIILFLFSPFLLTSCAGLNQQVESVIGSIDPQGIDINATTARAQIIARALVWVKLGIPYDQGKKRDGYRTDCSGFISYVWELKDVNGQPVSPDTVALGNNYASDISLEDIQGGDIINNKRAGNSGHTVLFVSWVNDEHTSFIAFEENGGYGKAIESELTIEYLTNGSFTIQEYDNDAPGPYNAQVSLNVP